MNPEEYEDKHQDFPEFWETELKGCLGPSHPHLKSITNYVMHGVPLSSFFTHVFQNDFVQAVVRADQFNSTQLLTYAQMLWNSVPTLCWGSPERVQEWIRKGGVSKNR